MKRFAAKTTSGPCAASSIRFGNTRGEDVKLVRIDHKRTPFIPK
jgi:hypothetical protein